MKGLPQLATKICTILLCIFLPFTMANAYHKNYDKPHLARHSKAAFTGFYFGAEGGYIRAQDNRQYQVTTSDTAQNYTDLLVQHDFLGGVFFGFGFPVHLYYYIGLQVEMLFNSAATVGSNEIFKSSRDDNTYGVTNNRFSLEHMINIVLTPGFFLSPNTLFYFRLGATFANLRFNYAYFPTATLSPLTSASLNIFRGGLLFGVGVKVAINDHFTVFTEGNYYTYSRVFLPGAEINGADLAFSEQQARVHVFTVLAGAAYAFTM